MLICLQNKNFFICLKLEFVIFCIIVADNYITKDVKMILDSSGIHEILIWEDEASN